MLTYKNILIAVDGSHEAEWAFNKAVDVAKRNDAKLTIVNIIDSRTYSSYEYTMHNSLRSLEVSLKNY